MPALQEVVLRQDLLERIEAAALDVDSVNAEIEHERSELSEIRTGLQRRRDKTVAYLNAASLIAGSGVGIAVNATQLKNSTAISGDVLGIASGAASTILSIAAIRKQGGPGQSPGRAPNMLAPLFDRKAVLNSYYTPEVYQYLETVPVGEDANRGRRLDQLKASWASAGRIGEAERKRGERQLDAMTASMDPAIKLTIQDLDNRMAMLGDVNSVVSLMKCDLAALLRQEGSVPEHCKSAY